jgi:hypothetical protein
MLRRNLATLALLVSIVPACSASMPMEAAAPPKSADFSAGAPADEARAAPPGGIAQPESAPARTSSAPSKGKEVQSDKQNDAGRAELIIYTGFLSEQVDKESFAKTLDAATDIAAAMGGYVAKQNNESVQLRVPSARFRDAMRELEKLGEVQTRNVEAQDVTEEAHDLDVRLQSLKAARKRIEDLMARAANMSEVLQIQAELAKVTGEIDRIEGRLRFLQAHAAMSTITLSLTAKAKSEPLKQIDPPPPPPPRTVALPIEWLPELGIDRLLKLGS